jgi:purine-binding chemotaxis protein CheW
MNTATANDGTMNAETVNAVLKKGVETDQEQFVTFALAGEEYGVDILKVQEIIGYKGFTKIPNVNECIQGVLNLRGAVVPVIDLRKKFKLEDKEFDKFTVIMIVEVQGKTMGLIVDAVSDVVSLNAEDVLPSPDFSTSVNTEFLKGMGRKDEKFIILLNIDKVMSADELMEAEAVVN